MTVRKNRPPGVTRDVGFQLWVKKTIPVSPDIAWKFLFSKTGLNIWLGEVDPDKFIAGEYFQTAGEDEGIIMLYKPHSHIRMNWKHSCWSNLSTLQLRVIPFRDKTTISFHQEKLTDSTQRKEMKAYWQKVLKRMAKELTRNNESTR